MLKIKVTFLWIFKYISTIKVEASGTPQGITTEEGLKQFIDEYLEKEGVQLDPQAIGELNKGLRMISYVIWRKKWTNKI